MKPLVYLIIFVLRRFFWRYFRYFLSKELFFFIFFFLFYFIVLVFIFVFKLLRCGFEFIILLVECVFACLKISFLIFFWGCKLCYYFICLIVSWFWVYLFFFFDSFFYLFGYVVFFLLFRVKGFFLFLFWRIFVELFSDVWLVVYSVFKLVRVSIGGVFSMFQVLMRLIVAYKLFFLLKIRVVSFIRVFYKLVRFVFFCFTYKYIFVIRKMYIYFIWRHLPVRNFVIGLFAEWASNRWWLFKQIVRIISWLSFFYDFFVFLYDRLIYRQVNWFLVSLQNKLYKLKGQFKSKSLEFIYRKLGILHGRCIRYFSHGSYVVFGGKQVWKKNEKFIFWRFYYFVFKSIIVIIVLVLSVLERCLRYLYYYWKLYFITGIRIPFYWKHFKEGVIMPVLNLEEVKPIVKMFLKKREKKYNKFLFVWLFFFFMHYVWIVVFVIARVIYVFVYCLCHWFKAVLVIFIQVIWKLAYYLKIWHVVLFLQFIYWNLVMFLMKLGFEWCCVLWYSFFRFLFNFYWELFFSRFFWYDWFVNMWDFWKLLYSYVLNMIRVCFFFLKSFVIFLEKFLVQEGRVGLTHFINLKGSYYRFQIWFVYYELYYYFLAWWRFFKGVDSIYNAVVYRDFCVMWNLRSYLINNKGILDYLKFFFWPQMDVYYRSAYVLQEILYLQVFRNLLRYRWFWADLRTYLWFIFNFVSFFFYFYFGSVHKVYLNSLFFRYLDIFRLFTVRRLLWMYVVEYTKLSFYVKDNKLFIWYQQVKYLRSFSWGFLRSLRERFSVILEKFRNLEENKFILVVLRYLYYRSVEWLVKRLERLFFCENLGLYYFFRICIFVVDFRSRLDFFIEYKRLEYETLIDKESMLARRLFVLENVFDEFKKEEKRKKLEGNNGKFKEVNGDEFSEKEEILEFLRKGGKSLRVKNGEDFSGGVAGIYTALPKFMGDMVNRYGKRVSAGDSLDYVAQYHVEGNLGEKIKNYFLYFMFMILVVLPWRIFDFFCYWVFDVLFVFLFLYVYLYFRILVLVLFFSIVGVIWVIVKILGVLLRLIVRLLTWCAKRIITIWRH